MNATDPESVGLAAKLLAAGASLFAGGIAAVKFFKTSMDKKADREQVDRHHDAIIDLYGKHEKVIDLLREKEQRDNGRHIELLTAIHQSRK